MIKHMQRQVDGERHGKEKMGEGRTGTKQKKLFHVRTGKRGVTMRGDKPFYIFECL